MICYTVLMALTRDDLQAIGKVVERVVEQKIQASEKRLIAAMDERFTHQAAYLSRSIADTVKLMAETYATKEKVEELEDEVDELKKELHALKRRIVPS